MFSRLEKEDVGRKKKHLYFWEGGKGRISSITVHEIRESQS